MEGVVKGRDRVWASKLSRSKCQTPERASVCVRWIPPRDRERVGGEGKREKAERVHGDPKWVMRMSQ